MTAVTTKASTSVPAFARFLLLIFEPLSTMYGVYLAFADPADLITNHFSRGTIAYAPETQVLYSQLAGMWTFLALIEAVVLSSFDDLRLWKRVAFCMLVCDVMYYHAVTGPVGGWVAFWDLRGWTGWNFFIDGALLTLTSARVAVLLSGEGKGKSE
ncbi:hypothetical protein QBC34DRAFT_213416 [Podospora aff. communis PSN243]|uniref:DUF7704 domain-containing protein n=1 Tax=Podospora aff. communis PSN243 TaxID=3040156 RepID=A0AAV9G521_9PEZI|nr:hypothetical protein QBC34DRAFT_213416 [Podospora aff. communis PSN243]